MKRYLSFIVLLCLIGGDNAVVQAQQPTVTGSAQGNKVVPFFTHEVLDGYFGADKVMLEHPSKPESLLRRPKPKPIVSVAQQKAKPSGQIPTRHLLENASVTPAEQPASQAVRQPSYPIAQPTPQPQVNGVVVPSQDQAGYIVIDPALGPTVGTCPACDSIQQGPVYQPIQQSPSTPIKIEVEVVQPGTVLDEANRVEVVGPETNGAQSAVPYFAGAGCSN